MSHTERAEKPEPQEREFPYVRQCCTGGPCDQAHTGPGAVYNLALHVPPPPPGARRRHLRVVR